MAHHPDCFQSVLKRLDPLLLQGYYKFIQEVIEKGIGHSNLTVENISTGLFILNKEAMDLVLKKAVSYYEEWAPQGLHTHEFVNAIQTEELCTEQSGHP